MLKAMRKHAKYFYVLFVIVILSFIFWGVGGVDQQTSKPLAVIGDETISLEQFWRTYDRAVELYRDLYKEEFDPDKMGLKQMVLASLIEERLLVAAAREVGISVSDSELEAEIVNDPTFMRNGAFSMDVYQRTLQLNRLSPSRYEAKKRNEMTLTRFRNLIEETVELSPSETRNLSGSEEVVSSLKEALLRNKRDAAVQSYIRGLKARIPVKVNSELIS